MITTKLRIKRTTTRTKAKIKKLTGTSASVYKAMGGYGRELKSTPKREKGRDSVGATVIESGVY